MKLRRCVPTPSGRNPFGVQARTAAGWSLGSKKNEPKKSPTAPSPPPSAPKKCILPASSAHFRDVTRHLPNRGVPLSPEMQSRMDTFLASYNPPPMHSSSSSSSLSVQERLCRIVRQGIVFLERESKDGVADVRMLDRLLRSKLETSGNGGGDCGYGNYEELLAQVDLHNTSGGNTSNGPSSSPLGSFVGSQVDNYFIVSQSEKEAAAAVEEEETGKNSRSVPILQKRDPTNNSSSSSLIVHASRCLEITNWIRRRTILTPEAQHAMLVANNGTSSSSSSPLSTSALPPVHFPEPGLSIRGRLCMFSKGEALRRSSFSYIIDEKPYDKEAAQRMSLPTIEEFKARQSYTPKRSALRKGQEFEFYRKRPDCISKAFSPVGRALGRLVGDKEIRLSTNMKSNCETDAKVEMAADALQARNIYSKDAMAAHLPKVLAEWEFQMSDRTIRELANDVEHWKVIVEPMNVLHKSRVV